MTVGTTTGIVYLTVWKRLKPCRFVDRCVHLVNLRSLKKTIKIKGSTTSWCLEGSDLELELSKIQGANPQVYKKHILDKIYQRNQMSLV